MELAADQITKLYNLFLKIDATQVEVNPFGETPEGQGMDWYIHAAMISLGCLVFSTESKKLAQEHYSLCIEEKVVCFDAKINFDDNAEFRQKDIFAMDDKSENEPIENEAAKYDLKYIGLDGNIACFVNGAGLAMATCDIIFLNGGKPANFLDLGGGVKEAQVYQAFKLLTADPKLVSQYVYFAAPVATSTLYRIGIHDDLTLVSSERFINSSWDPVSEVVYSPERWKEVKMIQCASRNIGWPAK
ncbi:Succinate--CoA ligase [GDP-forming] subunit beta, mitochondrial [Saguinus oedipus]|uniref:Succinate--CoA ligase [GDP-forming] subunit beta, mitochondrial n=1 Tax=Saguinus oedipus TaxID=9490 RepID=A0ABQ9U4K2_SAGOE|nr:Succinate--CoA ligase [GDP-forming] subunit beta, mitochondrial [Saguinus oedipus]